MPDIVSGKQNGRKWIAGTIPAKHLIYLDIDTRIGQGVPEILAYLKDFIAFQASKIFLSSYSVEDIEQELTAIAITAIPDYDAAKCANMLTFLQNHIKNRIINIYKFATEQRRTATHDNFRFCKVKCSSCLQHFIIDYMKESHDKCKICGYLKLPEERWTIYPIPVAMISANESVELSDGSLASIQEQSSYDDTLILAGTTGETENSILAKISLTSILGEYDVPTKEIAELLIEGHTMVEIAIILNLSKTTVRSKIRKLIKDPELIQLFDNL